MKNSQSAAREQHPRMSGEQRRALILEQAKKIFAQQSYAAASIGDLARASEVTEPVLYKHFGSKKNLYQAMLLDIEAEFLQRFQQLVNHRAEQDLLDGLANLLLDYRAAALSDHEGIHVLLRASLEANDPEIAKINQAHIQKIYKFVHDLLSKAQAEDLLAAHLDLTAATWGFLSLLFALQYRGQLKFFDQYTAGTIREVNRLWLQGLRSE